MSSWGHPELPHYFGDRPDIESDAMSTHVRKTTTMGTEVTERGGVRYHPDMPKPLSFLKPMTPYGDSYTPSYTRYLSSPANSYNNPLFPLFNDRRPQASPIRTTLKEGA